MCPCSANPVDNADGWPLATAQDFLPNHHLDSIDYSSIHMWSDNWGRTDVPFAQGWLESHMQAAKLLGKPLVLEEFGKAAGPFSAPLCWQDPPVHPLMPPLMLSAESHVPASP